jgi:UDP-glucose 6-dehydrogenase
MIKYMENCYLATKVVFCNSFAAACKKAGVEYDDVREGWLMDERVEPSHTIVYEDHPYYDSHCLNKDIPAFYNQFEDEFMSMVDAINKRRKV